MKPASTRPTIWLLCLACLLPGCLRLEREAPAKTSYVLSVEHPSPAASHRRGDNRILQVTPVSISPRFAGRGFTYRHSDSVYQVDFYHEFLIAPDRMVQEEIVRWLAAGKLFAAVGTAAGPLPPDYLLQGRILELYGDFRGEAPSGIIGMAFLLLDQHATDNPILLQRRYRSQIFCNGNSREALIEAWNGGIARILTALEKDLGDVIDRPDTAPAQAP